MIRDFPGWIVVVLIGSFAFLFAHIHFVQTWDALYAVEPWPGFEAAARRGLIDPWFGNSPRSLWITQEVLFALAAVIALLRRERMWTAGLVFWLGVMLPLVPFLLFRSLESDAGYLTTSRLLESGLWSTAILLEAARTVLPILLAVLVARILAVFGAVVRGASG